MPVFLLERLFGAGERITSHIPVLRLSGQIRYAHLFKFTPGKFVEPSQINVGGSIPRNLKGRFKTCNKQVLNLLGAGERTRTSDPRITNALLYQLSYSGIDLAIVCHPWRSIFALDYHRPRRPLARRSAGKRFTGPFPCSASPN